MQHGAAQGNAVPDCLFNAYRWRVMDRCPSPSRLSPFKGGRLDAVSSSARWEDVVGYSRAVKRGPFIYVSGEVLAPAAASSRVSCLPHYCVRGSQSQVQLLNRI